MIAEQTDRNINGGNLSFDFVRRLLQPCECLCFVPASPTRATTAQVRDPDAYGRTHDLTVATGAQYIHSFSRLWFASADLTPGRGRI